ncbi:MAG: hypothetical protein V8Q17_05290 [Acutalibacteraceae bacterium]
MCADTSRELITACFTCSGSPKGFIFAEKSKIGVLVSNWQS